jgi:hypothetical protein
MEKYAASQRKYVDILCDFFDDVIINNQSLQVKDVGKTSH